LGGGGSLLDSITDADIALRIFAATDAEPEICEP
jgi:hypothetical protein